MRHHPPYPKNIEWRADIESFFPPLQTDLLASRFRSELERYTSDLQNGWVVSGETMFRKHLTLVPTGAQSSRYEAKPGHEEFKDQFVLCGRLDNFLRSTCGKWLPDAFAYWVLSPLCQSDDPLRFGRSDHDKMIAALLSELASRRDDANTFLKETLAFDPVAPGDSATTALRRTRRTIEQLVRRTLENNGADDRWFGYLARETSMYLEAIGCEVAIEELEAFADLYFRDWSEPDEAGIRNFSGTVSARLIPNPAWAG